LKHGTQAKNLMENLNVVTQNALSTMNQPGATNWNPWSSLGNASLRAGGKPQTNSQPVELLQETEKESFEIVPSIKKELSSPTSQLSTKTWIEQQQEYHTQGELQRPDDVISIDSIPVQQEEITLFQGFRAIAPRSSIYFAQKSKTASPELVHLEVPQIRKESIASLSVGSVTSRLSKMPSKARHQAIAINNIAKLFSELLHEREILFGEAEEIEGKRVLRFNVACR
jgi:hypothetical protein